MNYQSKLTYSTFEANYKYMNKMMMIMMIAQYIKHIDIITKTIFGKCQHPYNNLP